MLQVTFTDLACGCRLCYSKYTREFSGWNRHCEESHRLVGVFLAAQAKHGYGLPEAQEITDAKAALDAHRAAGGAA